MKEESITDLGAIRIHNKVVSSIASIATQEVEGVAKISSSLKSSILDLLGKKYHKGIKVEIDKNNELKIDVPVIVKYGFNLPEIANKIQDSIRKAIEKMTDLSIKEININIQGIERG